MNVIQPVLGPVSERTWDEIYQELKRLAHRKLYGCRSHTLSTTALVNEVYIKLVKGQDLNVSDRNHLMALSCRAMRQVLVDYARRKVAQKRQMDKSPAMPGSVFNTDLLAVDEALKSLAEMDPRLVQLVECRFYGGLKMLDVLVSAVEGAVQQTAHQ